MKNDVLYEVAQIPNAVEQINNLLKENIKLPNLPIEVMDEGVMWDTLIETNGWKLQQNEFTRHCRVLDQNGVRRSWGTKKGMEDALEILQKAKRNNKKLL